ncbi:hypothetical protein Amsp01_079490 [Amycolatopsis sp. NBRC 101858]|nr:hypothetical protein Amsp01_079490 [Amycolatopsis sp. NBRC 101858]
MAGSARPHCKRALCQRIWGDIPKMGMSCRQASAPTVVRDSWVGPNEVGSIERVFEQSGRVCLVVARPQGKCGTRHHA